MSWYLIALVLGIIAPWFVPGGPIGVAFEEGGLKKGLRTWLGISLATLPTVLLLMWRGHFSFRRNVVAADLS